MLISKKLIPVAGNTNQKLTPMATALATRQVVTDLTSQNRGNEAITPIESGKVLGFLPIPKKFTITIFNGGLVPLDIPFLNNADFVGLGVAVVATYSDGFGGKLLTRLMNSLQMGNGLLTYGFNVTGKDALGVRSDSVLNAMEMEARYYNGRGVSYLPVEIDFSGGERNTQFKDGLLTIKTMVTLNCVTQLKVHLGAGETAEFVFSTIPLQD